jgi:hypothetical protein
MLKTRLTLVPGANGTKKLVERYGTRLVCVRYRYDAERRKRIKTVELIEDESPWMPAAAIYLVKIGYEESSLREKIKEAGGRWSGEKKVWLMTGVAVRRLQLEDRVVAWLDPQ